MSFKGFLIIALAAILLSAEQNDFSNFGKVLYEEYYCEII